MEPLPHERDWIRGITIDNRVLIVGKCLPLDMLNCHFFNVLMFLFTGGTDDHNRGTIYELDITHKNWTWPYGYLKFERHKHAVSVVSNETWKYCL